MLDRVHSNSVVADRTTLMLNKDDIGSDPVWITINESLGRWPVGRTALYELLVSELIEARKFGKKTIVNRQSGDRYFAGLPKFGKAA